MKKIVELFRLLMIDYNIWEVTRLRMKCVKADLKLLYVAIETIQKLHCPKNAKEKDTIELAFKTYDKTIKDMTENYVDSIRRYYK